MMTFSGASRTGPGYGAKFSSDAFCETSGRFVGGVFNFPLRGGSMVFRDVEVYGRGFYVRHSAAAGRRFGGSSALCPIFSAVRGVLLVAFSGAWCVLVRPSPSLLRAASSRP